MPAVAGVCAPIDRGRLHAFSRSRRRPRRFRCAAGCRPVKSARRSPLATRTGAACIFAPGATGSSSSASGSGASTGKRARTRRSPPRGIAHSIHVACGLGCMRWRCGTECPRAALPHCLNTGHPRKAMEPDEAPGMRKSPPVAGFFAILARREMPSSEA